MVAPIAVIAVLGIIAAVQHYRNLPDDTARSVAQTQKQARFDARLAQQAKEREDLEFAKLHATPDPEEAAPEPRFVYTPPGVEVTQEPSAKLFKYSEVYGDMNEWPLLKSNNVDLSQAAHECGEEAKQQRLLKFVCFSESLDRPIFAVFVLGKNVFGIYGQELADLLQNSN